jgi:anthranilate phosphoribosyltransferase
LLREETEQLMRGILGDVFDPIQVAVLLIGLRMKHESADELAGMFDAMQAQIEPICVNADTLLCLADPFDGYVRHLPMTPFLPSVLAACGLPTVLHGVENVGPKHGITAGKVYRAMNVALPESTQECADRVNVASWGYIEQKVYLSSLARLNEFRDKIVKRTAITTLERVLKPLAGKHNTWFALGYVHKAYPEIYASVAQRAGYEQCVLLKGVEGGLMLGLNKPRRVYHFDELNKSSEPVKQSFEAYREDIGHQAMPNEASVDSAVIDCLELGLNVLGGDKGIARDSLVLSAATILSQFNVGNSFTQAVENVEESLDNGLALQYFKKF